MSELARENVEVYSENIGGVLYSSVQMFPVMPPVPSTMLVYRYQSYIDYLTSNLDELNLEECVTMLQGHVKDPEKSEDGVLTFEFGLVGKLNMHMQRPTYIVCQTTEFESIDELRKKLVNDLRPLKVVVL